MALVKKKHSSGSRFSRQERRRLAGLIRKFGIKGARIAFKQVSGRYVSHVTLWRIAGENGIEPKPGRPSVAVTPRSIRKRLGM